MPGTFPSWVDTDADSDSDAGIDTDSDPMDIDPMDIDSEPPTALPFATFPSTPLRAAQPEVAVLRGSPDMSSMPGAWPSGQDDSDFKYNAPSQILRSTTLPSGILSRIRLYFNVFTKTSRITSNVIDDGGPETSKRVRISPPEQPASPDNVTPTPYRRGLTNTLVKPPFSRLRSSSFIGADAIKPWSSIKQQETPPPEDKTSSGSHIGPKSASISPGTARFSNIEELFHREGEFSLPGLGAATLLPSIKKVGELGEQKNERIRFQAQTRAAAERAREAAERERISKERARIARENARAFEERRRAEIKAHGLRSPRDVLISPLSPRWDQRARATVDDGVAKVPNPEGTEVTSHDFARLVPDTAWLNDNIIQAVLALLAHEINNAAGITIKKDTPKCVALSPLFWAHICSNGPSGNERRLKRTWGVTPDNFHQIETFLLPINHGSHWTVVVIRPSRRTVAYVDSFQSSGSRELSVAYSFISAFLGNRYKEDEWETVHYRVPRQTNSYDCGMFVITNSIYLALGIDPSCYSQADMPLMRRRMAAMLLNGGFTGDFGLRAL